MGGMTMKYFVLKPKGTNAYARASRRAMFAYAQSVMEENPELSRELWDWASNEKLAAIDPDEWEPPAHWEPKE